MSVMESLTPCRLRRLSPSKGEKTPCFRRPYSPFEGESRRRRQGVPTSRANGQSGFSLFELLVGLVLMLLVGMVAFRLFQQSDRSFRDQNLIVEMQQNVRAVATQIADELKMGGQNVPIYNSRFDSAPLEAAQMILNGSDGSRILFRSGVTNVNGRSTGPPLAFPIGAPATLTNVSNAAAFQAALGAVPPPGRFVYIYGKTQNLWSWVRAEVTAISTTLNTIAVTPAQSGTMGTTFTAPVSVSLEEAISYRLNGDAILRGVVTNFSSLTSPTMSESTIGENFTGLQFAYFDRNDNAITPNTLANRAQVWRVDITAVGQTSRNLTNGTRPTFAMTVRAFPRNAGVE